MDGESLSKQARAQYIDILKALAILGVILVHYNERWASPLGILSGFSAIGARCPQFFFEISSFLTCYSFYNKDEVNVISFYKKRFFRIAPLYYLAIVVFVLVPEIKLFDYSIVNYLSHIFLINGFNPYWIGGIMGLEWYVADLVILYLLTPFIMKIATNLKRSIVLFINSFIVSSGSLVLFNNIIALDFQNSTIEMFYHTFFFIHQLPIWIIGICIFYTIKEAQKERKFPLLLSAYVVFAGIIIGLYALFDLNKRLITSSIIAGLLMGIIFLCCSRLKILNNHYLKPIAFVGKYSFGIYLFHNILLNCFERIINTINSTFNWIFFYVLMVLLTIVIGYLVEKIVGMIMSKLHSSQKTIRFHA